MSVHPHSPYWHPSYYYRPRWHWHRGPHRLFWFAAGTFAGVWWMKHKDVHTTAACSRVASSHHAGGTVDTLSNTSAQAGPITRVDHDPAQYLNHHQLVPSQAKLGEIKESVADISESVLDAALTALQTLRNKLAEERASHVQKQVMPMQAEHDPERRI